LTTLRFNTDGIDVSGHNVWIHDCDIWSQDDVISVKGNGYGDRVSSNMLFERINGTGLGFVIGSIRDSAVRNITFRDSYLHKSIKGIYMKFRRNDNYEGGVIENITYENITMESPQQFAIWIGPAQQADR
jgi:polygalacturonase